MPPLTRLSRPFHWSQMSKAPAAFLQLSSNWPRDLCSGVHCKVLLLDVDNSSHTIKLKIKCKIFKKKGGHSGQFFNFQVSRISNREQEPGDFQLPLPLQHPYFCLQVYKTGNGTVGDENLNSHPHFQWIPEPFKILLVREPLSGVSVCKYLFTHEIASDQTRWIF